MSKRILLIIGGGISAYKTLELIRLCKKQNISVTPVLTKAATQFVTELSVTSLAQEHAHTDLFSPTLEAQMGHIALTRQADLVVVAPATADLMAKMAHGLANDLASTLLLASNKSVLLAPAMNVEMWNNKATQRNIQTLTQDGHTFVGPNGGDLACGEEGLGRMAEPFEIFAAIEACLSSQKKNDNSPLKGKHILITAGPTVENLDPVRFISNRSSGKQGFALAKAASQMGAKVTLIAGPVHLPTPEGVKRIDVQSATQMLAAVQNALPADVFIATAAVADFKPKLEQTQKLKKSDLSASLELEQNPDILKTIGHLKSKRPKVVVGFAAETQNVLQNAQAKLAAKGADIIIANDVSPHMNVMGSDENTIHILTQGDRKSFEKMSKDSAAHIILQGLAKYV